MESIGKYLKEQRESQNLTIDDVSQSTRLKPYMLAQLENEEFDAIGDTGFVKILVITYCRAINGDEALMRQKLASLFNSPTQPPIKIKTAKNVKPVIFSLNIFYFFSLAILAIILTATLLTIYQKGTFSFNEIKNQLTSIDKRIVRTSEQTTTEPDSLWAFQRSIFNEANKINEELDKPIVNKAKIDTISKSADTKVVGRHINSTKMYIKDKTDYAGQLIFNNVPGPLNPDI